MTAWPRARSAASKWPPTNPPAPVTRMRTSALRRRTQPFEIGADHLLDQLLARHLGPPAELPQRLGRVTDEQIDFGRAIISRVDDDVLLPIEIDRGEREPHEVANRVRPAGRDDVVVRFR